MIYQADLACNKSRTVNRENQIKGEVTGVRSTDKELVILGGLDGAILGKALDDFYGLLELGFRHGGLCTRGSERR